MAASATEKKRAPRRKAVPSRLPPALPQAPPGPDEVCLGHGLTMQTGPNRRFLALSMRERQKIIAGFIDFARQALDGRTMKEYLADRRREAERDA